MRKFLIILVVLAMAIGAFVPVSSAQTEPAARNVILLIGDGMGITHVRAAEIFASAMWDEGLAISTIPTRAVTTTHSASSLVTDSAASGSAIHSGYKFNNGAINVLPDGDVTYTLGQAAKAAGKSVGVVSTTRLTHATPASVFAHVPDRDMENEIAAEMVEFAPEVALGGGRRNFLPESENGRREDDRNLIAEMEDMGYVYASTGSELAALDLDTTDKLLGFFTSSHMSYELDRQMQEFDEPTVAEMTSAALAVLGKNDAGFFLMVEGGRIDHAAHAHDPAGVVYDMLAFDDAIQVALDYQAENSDTLVVVTTDHETGGMSIGKDTGYFADIAALAPTECTMEYIDGMITPENALDIAEGCGIFLTDEEKEEMAMFDPDAEQEAYGAWNLAHYILTMNQSDLSGVGWTTWSHTGQPVLTYAIGPGADMFVGTIDDTDIPKFIATDAGLTLEEPTPAEATID